MKVDFHTLDLFIGTEKLERIGNDYNIKSYKFIGHHLDEHLTFEHHINHVHSKLALNFMDKVIVTFTIWKRNT